MTKDFTYHLVEDTKELEQLLKTHSSPEPKEDPHPNPFHFQLSDKLCEWIKNHEKYCHSHTTSGEHFQISFIPTGIVECQKVECLVCGAKETDYID